MISTSTTSGPSARLGGVHWHNVTALSHLAAVLANPPPRRGRYLCTLGRIKSVETVECQHGLGIALDLEDTVGTQWHLSFRRAAHHAWIKPILPDLAIDHIAFLQIYIPPRPRHRHRTGDDEEVEPQLVFMVALALSELDSNERRLLRKVDRYARKLARIQRKAPNLVDYDRWLGLLQYSCREWRERM
ncbi:uncharacterized protein PFL1_00118 [Pseudozyma flocculosa PF-1]|uniref:uncharacterized protein n=1 Tax=Pseudozyma flocculosa PF-1 TaxID=1277687 RepID=UPI0004560FCD|nr:uncharacterized protein PFL1_00118 [Pseudozyma flocculosa PF-1]EPQ31919.1 hypothetical protein PFL1_00118 [Pseudozyma flocculosa PF-1]